MTTPQRNRVTKLAELQTSLIYVAVACFLFSFYFDGAGAKVMFGFALQYIKILNGVVMWASAVLSGRKFLMLIESIKKASQRGEIDNE